jgi:hypothetical protein
MAVIIFFVTQLLKMPIKCGTKHIKNADVRKKVNATILLIPFVLGVLADFLYSSFVLHTDFTVIAGLGYGTAGISLYGVVERFFKVKVENPYETADGKLALDIVDKVQQKIEAHNEQELKKTKAEMIAAKPIELKKVKKTYRANKDFDNL